MRYRIDLSYVGTHYHGWQSQPNASTVQETLEDALGKVLRENISVTGCGRTDTGVHAEYYVAHFDANAEIDAKIIDRLNGLLPDDISIFSIVKADESFHARFDAKKRSYKYVITQRKNPFLKGFSWHVRYPLNVAGMQEAADKLFNYTDFTSFSKLHTDVKTNNCKIYRAEFVRDGDRIVFYISADRFLRNMVRAIVGTLVEVGKDKLSVDDFCSIIESKDRCEAGQSVPADGLFLTEVEY
ncbi:MAG: tRNA pseudouridine(38-40) synthase TruA [Bacteroidales bacterium]|nr:tRNA pseudouridine(38-40) synthase TruA [Bacteroidales bacterium]